ncbi:MAG: Holliday junction branch migration protein RuvA, partial [Desulforhopalus sp.]
TTLPGVGKRTAERICVDLKEKVSHLVSGTVPVPGGSSRVVAVEGSAAADAISALVNLGYQDSVAREALGKVKKQLGEEKFSSQKVEVLIREALRALA